MTNYNHIIDFTDITGESGVFEEPVAIDEVKDFLRLEGFIDDLNSPSSDFDDDDLYLSVMIGAARKSLEEYTGLSFIPKTLQVELTNLAGNIELPYGPVISITSVEDVEGNALTYTTTSNLSKLKTPTRENVIVTYEAGFVKPPSWVKLAIMNEVGWRYMNRGDENVGISTSAKNICSPFISSSWLG